MKYDLTKWRSNLDPFRAFEELEHEMDKIFSDFPFNPRREMRPTKNRNFSPACDFSETDSHYLVSVDLPGMNKDDVNVEVREGMLTISGERKSEHKEEGYQERYFGSFTRSFTLPKMAKVEEIEANFENGVLRLAIPKPESAKTPGKKIEIKEGKSSFFKNLLSGSKKGDKH